MASRHHPITKLQAHGFTLVEMTLVLAILGVLLQGFFAWKQSTLHDDIIRKTVAGFALIDEALYAYRVDQGIWPGDITALSAYLPTFQNTNGIGHPYAIRRAAGGLIISTQMDTTEQQVAVAAEFPANGQLTGTTGVEVGIPLPGLESAHAALLHKSGGPTQAMQGNLHLALHDIKNAGKGEFQRIILTRTSTTGAVCSLGEIILDTDGRLLTCDRASQRFRHTSAAQVHKKTANSETLLRPPAGFQPSQCAISVSGRPPASGQRITVAERYQSGTKQGEYICPFDLCSTEEDLCPLDICSDEIVFCPLPICYYQQIPIYSTRYIQVVSAIDAFSFHAEPVGAGWMLRAAAQVSANNVKQSINIANVPIDTNLVCAY